MKNTNQHTPALRWSSIQLHNPDRSQLIRNDSATVARVEWLCNDDESERLAALIESAPELLAALENSLRVMREQRAPEKQSDWCFRWMLEPIVEPCDCAICQARAVLAKVKGQP